MAQNLDSTIDDGLEARARDAAAVVDRRALRQHRRAVRAGARAGRHACVDTTDGRRRAAAARRRPSSSGRAPGDVIVERRRDGADAAAAGPAGRRPTARAAILVVGESLAQRERALDSLHALLLIGGPLALLIASAVGYALAAAALRPVERMRRHAAAVTAAQTSERLPVPPANDEIGRLGRTLNEMLARLEVAFKRERAFVERRLARAAHAARDPAHGARAGAARRAHARGARGRAALRGRGVRAALATSPRTCS